MSPMPISNPTPVSPSPRAEPVLVAIDTYGTRQTTQDKLMRACGPDLRALGEASMSGYPPPDALLEKLRHLGDFADVSPIAAPPRRLGASPEETRAWLESLTSVELGDELRLRAACE